MVPANENSYFYVYPIRNFLGPYVRLSWAGKNYCGTIVGSSTIQFIVKKPMIVIDAFLREFPA